MPHLRLRPLPRKSKSTQNSSPENNNPPTTRPGIGTDGFTDKKDDDEQYDDYDDAEDIFSAFLPHLLPDDAPQFHGDPGQLLQYRSPLYGDLTVMVPQYPEKWKGTSIAGQSKEGGGIINDVEESRKLFAHMLWSSAMVVAEKLEDAATIITSGEKLSGDDLDRASWSVQGHTVLELGAGAGLPSVISALSSASHVTITDHPSSPAFLGAIEYNIRANVPSWQRESIVSTPHEWGALDSQFARDNKGRFSRIIAADCLWMIDQHENLARTLQWFLDSSRGRAWVVAGLHTGRAVVAHFFEMAVTLGLEIEGIYECDINNTDEDQGERRREWAAVREDEGLENRKRWCVVAVLKRARLDVGNADVSQ
ncbi:hypothetical protein PISL3812_02762 [Talaromyces islandicus]|uniref:Nicotinamide N-methyltransferase n=1 Tax=Talaromyces islandicus TaxID=28573 RepID=A0A0U1LT40_TALIS|nr:hypothetical protein PISL3812_02762 [Talaromyces islandicus]